MGVYIDGMEMPTTCGNCPVHKLWPEDDEAQCMIVRTLWTKYSERNPDCPLVPVQPHGRLRKRIVYRGEVYNALESARINALDGILTDRYKDGFHDGLKRALEILADEVEDAPTIIPAEEG